MSFIDINFKFSSAIAQKFFECSKRNIGWNSGFGAGKSYTACQKAVALLSKFPGYRIAIGRKSLTDLKKTTMQTFYKVCPAALYDKDFGGRIVEAPVPYTELINGSRVYWIHLEKATEQSVRSLEINAAIIDQAEEVEESTYIELDNRIGRWDEVEVPQDLLQMFPNWPRNEFTGRPMAPAYHIVLFNPPDEGEFSYLYERYHPDSEDWKKKYSRTHQYFQSSSRDNKALPKENLENLLTRDVEWQHRFVEGNFSRGEGAIHQISKLSILEVDEDWVRENLLKRASLARVLDHGASAPTCCTWWAASGGAYYCYREYYVADSIVSVHRKNITDLSIGEEYQLNLADPAIFRKESEKYGGFWSTALEYSDEALDAPPLFWAPADNNEFSTRNRINELLQVDPGFKHPITGELGSPKLFFLKRTERYQNGVVHAIKESASQKKKLLAEINGKKIYCDDRDPGIADHSYDTVRYYCASHLRQKDAPKPKPKPNSFIAVRNRIKALQLLEEI